MLKNHFLPGENNVTCDVCSKKIKSSNSRVRWDGLLVCKDDYEPRQPQDFVKGQRDKITVPFVRPIPTLEFTDVSYVDTGNTTIPPGNNHGEL